MVLISENLPQLIGVSVVPDPERMLALYCYFLSRWDALVKKEQQACYGGRNQLLNVSRRVLAVSAGV
jgi:hypothetical protein